MNPKISFSRLVFLTALCFSLIACQAEEKKGQELGREVSAAEVEQSLKSALMTLDVSNVREGDFVHQVHRLDYMSPSGPQGQILQESGINIWNYQETATQISYTLVREVVDYTSDGPQKSLVSEEPVVINKSELRTSSWDAFTNLFSAEPLIALWESLGNEFVQPFEARVTYHRLVHEKKYVAPPAAVQARENCSGIPDCKMLVHVVKYDEAIHQPGQKPQVMTNRFWFTPDAPFHAGILKECYKRLVKWEGTFLLVTECRNVEDFRFGSAD